MQLNKISAFWTTEPKSQHIRVTSLAQMFWKFKPEQTDIRAAIPVTAVGHISAFKIQNAGSTDIKTRSICGRPDAEGLEVILGGDSELRTIVHALKFITKVLEDEINGARD